METRVINASPVRVCLVDNLEIVLFGLEKLIASQAPRMEVVGQFTQCADALSQLEKISPDIILLGLNFYNKDEIIEAIPQFTASCNAKILVLTVLPDLPVYDSVMLAGARGVLSKTERLETIVKAIEKVHLGEIWLDHACISRLISECAAQKSVKQDDTVQKKLQTLTPKEKKIVATLNAHIGVPGKVIASNLDICESTLRNHLTSIYEKLGVCNRLELWNFMHKHGIDEELK